MTRRRRAKKPLPPSTAPGTLPVGLILATLLTAAFLLRLLASRGDLWLDEILSVEVARSLARLSDVVFATQAQVDNNHVLNTTWLYAFGDRSLPVLLRLHSAIAGTVSIASAYAFAKRWGRSAALFSAALFGSAFVMINYASEARGYGLMVCFTMLALVAIDRALERRSIASTALFWMACALGTLAHVLFVETFLAIVTWTLVRFLGESDRPRGLASFALQYHVFPLLFQIGLYVVFIRHMDVLGANPSVMFDVVGQTAAFLLGLPRSPFWSLIALAIVGAVVVVGVRSLRRDKDDAWVLMVMLCAGAPAAIVIFTNPGFVLPRYFLVPATGVLLLMGMLLGRLCDRNRVGRVIAFLAFAAFAIANSLDTARLVRAGRGQYSRAMHDIAANTSESLLRIGGDHEFRQRTVLSYYQQSLPAGKGLEYVSSEPPAEVAPEWVVMHSFDPGELPATPAIVDSLGREYKLFRVYPSGPLSGWFWYVYRRT